MNYVVVDFEWNQSPYGKGSVNGRMPFEIIEIGAVLLDENLEEIDRFSETIKPKVYKKLHYMTRDLTGITQEELNNSDPFPYILADFMLWCGDDFIFCTWGNTDLIELQRNMRYYDLEDLLPGPLKYYNVQKFFRHLYVPEVNAASLEYAVDYFNLPKDAGFHRAVNDAAYTADILRQINLDAAERLFSVDYYQNPKSKEEEIHLCYDTYYKFISREFSTKEQVVSDREVRATRCYLCDKPVRKKMHWFVGKTKNYYCLAYCPEHGYVRGKIRIKRTDENMLYAVKTIRIVDEEEALKIRQMKLEVMEKRREKRHRNTNPDGDTSS